MALSNGLEGPFGQRVKALASPSSWEFFMKDFPDDSDEPLSRKLAEQCMLGLPALLAGQPWPFGEGDE
ncbi:hypothetical protein [Propionivibrio sp.]|uniref:hypothetical protein n=1 Tax=Propionivibrio sp. TaxID=2212460 RepID=UPI003BF55628